MTTNPDHAIAEVDNDNTTAPQEENKGDEALQQDQA
jgi:hypothetical protein